MSVCKHCNRPKNKHLNPEALRHVIAKIANDAWRKGLETNMVLQREIDEWMLDILEWATNDDADNSYYMCPTSVYEGAPKEKPSHANEAKASEWTYCYCENHHPRCPCPCECHVAEETRIEVGDCIRIVSGGGFGIKAGALFIVEDIEKNLGGVPYWALVRDSLHGALGFTLSNVELVAKAPKDGDK